jgi:hypothetical protein
MQDALKAFIAKTGVSITEVVGESIVSVLYAIMILIALLIAYKVSKKLIIGAMLSHKRTDPQVRQFMAMWRYSFLLIAIIFVIVSLSGSLAAMGLTVAFISMILGWSLQRPVTGVAAWLMVNLKRDEVTS